MNVFSGNSRLLQSPEETEAVVGENVTLRCRTDITSTTNPIEWRNKIVDAATFDFVFKSNRAFKNRFHVIPNRATGQYDLIIDRVELRDAGRYTCGDKDDTHDAELIVFGK